MTYPGSKHILYYQKSDGRSRRPKLAEELAHAIEKDILAQGWREGRSIGNEAALVERYRASRWTVRQAITIVERDGLARMRRGRNGGLVVATPGSHAEIWPTTT
jgi:DNA-binding FadR family transcriptional regulator